MPSSPSPAARTAELLGVPASTHGRLGGGDIACTSLVGLADGRQVVCKSLADAPEGLFAAEEQGLRWLGVAGGPPIPSVLAVAPDAIVLSYVAPGPPSPTAAADFGAALACLHQSTPPSFGAGWPGFIGTLPMDNTPGDSWPDFFVRRRVLPYLQAARDRGTLSAEDARRIESVCRVLPEIVPTEPPARLHGDLWSGNMHWDNRSRAWLIDPAAHGGHRESDLAMLILFGAPHLERVVEGYESHVPLVAGWRDRIPIHQLFPLLAHAVLFGGSYGARAARNVARFAAGP